MGNKLVTFTEEQLDDYQVPGPLLGTAALLHWPELLQVPLA